MNMTASTTAFTISSIALAAALAACGGGGSSTSPSAPTNSTGQSNPATSTPQPISLLAAPGTTTSPLTATGDVVNDSFAYVNTMRAQLGLPALKYVSAVGVAALSHAKNMQETGIVGHYEIAGQPDYTGVTPSDRVAAAGYKTNSTGEIAAGLPGSSTGFSSSTQAIDGLFDAPFHRAIYLFDTTGVGMGDVAATDPAKHSTFVADFVDYVASTPDNKLVAYPYDGQKNVKPQWTAIETPNPMSAKHPELIGKQVGYPITLSAAGNGAFSNVAFTITDAAGNNVPCDETDNSNNQESTRLAICVSPTVLADNTAYKVTVTGALTNTSITPATPFSVSWSFTTGANGTSSNTSPTPVAAGTAKSLRRPTGSLPPVLN